MGSKGKINRSNFRNKSLGRRRRDTRNLRHYYLIICEGQKTEPNYFKALKKELPKGIVDVEIEGTGFNTRSLVEKAEQIKLEKEQFSTRQFDEVWVIFDRDDFSPEDFNAAIIKCDNKDNFYAGYSNEAFELWFLLHFAYYNSGMSRDQFKAKLEGHIRRESGNKRYSYRKNDPEMYTLLKQWGNESQAIKNSKRLLNLCPDQQYANHNPSTTIHKLIESIRSRTEKT